jgi:hypothetical protein
MADFYGCLESTSFRVKDRAAFLSDPEVAVLQAQENGFWQEDDGFFSFGWYGQYPSVVLTLYGDDLPDGSREINISETIHRHIFPGDVCQIGVSGNEKLLYIGGDMWWITSKGIISIDGQTCCEDRLTEDCIRRRVDALVQETKILLPAEAAA